MAKESEYSLEFDMYIFIYFHSVYIFDISKYIFNQTSTIP